MRLCLEWPLCNPFIPEAPRGLINRPDELLQAMEERGTFVKSWNVWIVATHVPIGPQGAALWRRAGRVGVARTAISHLRSVLTLFAPSRVSGGGGGGVFLCDRAQWSG